MLYLSRRRAASPSFLTDKKDAKIFFFVLSIVFKRIFPIVCRSCVLWAPSFGAAQKKAKSRSRGRTAPLQWTVRRTQRGKGRQCYGRRKQGTGLRACPLHNPRSRRAVMQHKEGSLLKRGTTDWPLPFRNPFKSIPTWVRPGIVKGILLISDLVPDCPCPRTCLYS